ncbi:MAG: 23S rRNA (pseudouridine(1915)-N(3))-methyltransferase RlmH, partial [Eubacterium sp.]
MMKITIIAVGKLKEKFLKDGCAEYIKRISPYARVNIVEIPEERCSDNPTPGEIAKVIDKEGQRIADKIPKSSAVFALCIEGTQLSSEDFAQKIQS